MHIPHVAPGFWEKFYFRPGNLGYPTFDLGFVRIGVYICYDRHFPEGARALGLNGAEIVFNPSATVAGLSEHLWKIEQPAHAVANGYFIAAINRVGMEAPWNIGHFYGSSYFCNPRGQIVAEASREKDEVLTADLDLDQIKEVRQTWQFFRDRRPDSYVDLNQAMTDNFPRSASRADAASRTGRGHALPVLLRRAVRPGLPDPHRRSEVYQENRQRQSARLGDGDSRCEHFRPQLFPRLPGGRAVRRRLRDASLQQAAHRDRPAAAPRDGLVLRPFAVRCGRAGQRQARSLHRRRTRVARLRGRTSPPRFRGHHFRSQPLAGGLNTYGIAQYKLRPGDSLKEVELVRSMGVKFRLGEEVNDNTQGDFDAFFLGDRPGRDESSRMSPAKICRT